MKHIRHQIPIPELDGLTDDDRIWCAWSDCDNPASSLHTGVECFASRKLSSHSELPARPECSECRRVAFCSDTHKGYYFRSHIPGQFGRRAGGTTPLNFLVPGRAR